MQNIRKWLLPKSEQIHQRIVACCLVTLLAGITMVLAAQSVTAAPTLVFVEPTSANERHLFTDIVEKASRSFKNRLGLDLGQETKIYISSSPQNLVDAYAKHYRGKRPSNKAEKVRRYREFSSAEAKYRVLFISLGSKRFPSNSRNRKVNLVFHEFFHLLQYELIGRKSDKCCRSDRVPVVGPVWLMEGSAEYMARVMMQAEGYEGMSGYLGHIERNFRANSPDSLQLLETRHGMDQVEGSYDHSAYAVHALVQGGGYNSIQKFYSSLRKTTNWKRAFERSFGITVDDFYHTLN